MKQYYPPLECILQRPNFGRTELHRWCLKGNVDKVKEFLPNASLKDLNALDNDGMTPL